MKKLLGAIAFIVILLAAWVYQQGGLEQFQKGHTDSPAVVVAPEQPVAAPVQPRAAVAEPREAADNLSRNALKRILATGIVRVSVQNPSEPFYERKDRIAHGFNVDFARLLFSDASFSISGRSVMVDMNHEVDAYTDVPRQLLQADAGGIPVVDIAMDGLTFPDNSPQGVVYSVPYIDDFGYSLIVRQGASITSVAHLVGKRVGIIKGDPDVRAFVARAMPNSVIVEVDDAEAGFIAKSIDGGSVDAFIYDYPFAVESLKNTDLRFAATKLDGSNIAYRIGVRAQDQELLIYLNSAIAKARESQQYLNLLRQYFISNQAEVSAATKGERLYTVRQGDTLNTIAASQLGNAQRYREIQKRNNLANPNLIIINQQLIMPAR